MDYENYIELYEAVYFFSIINEYCDKKSPQQKIKELGLNESIYKAIVRILVVNNLIDFDGEHFFMTNKNKAEHQHILDNIIKKNKHYVELFDKATNEFEFFFNSISDVEYEIYSRCNFHLTLEIGKEIIKNLNFENKKVLELGGNSGGLGTAVLSNSKSCSYSVVDTKIPCNIGNELKKSNEVNITFIEGNIFKLNLPCEIYDYIIIMNLLHDFDDSKCLDILSNCIKHCDCNTKFIIIEDILTNDFEPKELIMHGLRLSVNCRGGKQRTSEELSKLFLSISYKIEESAKLSDIHTMLIIGAI